MFNPRGRLSNPLLNWKMGNNLVGEYWSQNPKSLDEDTNTLFLLARLKICFIPCIYYFTIVLF